MPPKAPKAPPKKPKARSKPKKDGANHPVVSATPQRLNAGGARRGSSNYSRYSRGMLGQFAHGSQLMQSVLNGINNMPSFLQRHIDDRMERMHNHLLFKADEASRSKPVKMDVDEPPPPPQPAKPMDTATDPEDFPVPTNDSGTAPMEAAPTPMASRDPLSTRQTATMEQGAQTERKMPNVVYRPPQKVTIRTHTVMPAPPKQSRTVMTQSWPGHIVSSLVKRPRETQAFGTETFKFVQSDVDEISRASKKGAGTTQAAKANRVARNLQSVSEFQAATTKARGHAEYAEAAKRKTGRRR